MILTSSTQAFDSRLGIKVNSFKYLGHELDVSYPTASWDHVQTWDENLYSLAYKTASGTSFLPRISTTLSSQPLITHPIFQPTGSHELSASDREKIFLALSDTALWGQYVAAAPTTPLGWYAQFQLWGVESWLCPVKTLRVSKIVTARPDFSKINNSFNSISNVSLPTLGNRENWLLISMESEQVQSSCWIVTYEYQASFGTTWDLDLYPVNS